MKLPFQITKQFSDGTEKLIATFNDENDAMEFMNKKIAWDHKTKVDTIYRSYSHSDLLKEVKSKEFESIESSDRHANENREQRSSLSPFNTAPKPPGTLPGKSGGHNYDDEQ